MFYFNQSGIKLEQKNADEKKILLGYNNAPLSASFSNEIRSFFLKS